MKNLKTWIHNYKNLSFEQQYEVAKAIVESLDNRQYYFMQTDGDIIKVINFFKKLIDSSYQQMVIDGKTSLLKRFEELSQVNKEKAFSAIIKVIESTIKEQEQETKEETCKRERHLFNEWKKRTWTTREVVWDAGPQGYMNVKHNEWYRTCSRCGFVENVNIEPQELIEEKEKATRSARIKSLEKELKELKSFDD